MGIVQSNVRIVHFAMYTDHGWRTVDVVMLRSSHQLKYIDVDEMRGPVSDVD